MYQMADASISASHCVIGVEHEKALRTEAVPRHTGHRHDKTSFGHWEMNFCLVIGIPKHLLFPYSKQVDPVKAENTVPGKC